ncbi:bacteriocin-protection protein, YdeI/OmpD-associated family [Candidatus Microgenomates bacterium]|nr:MAG: bacteriocin-protection protein, YdeI/OmpD-associated family [Candidatus Microgenomates bacterium]
MTQQFDLPLLTFQTQDEWREWLLKNHATQKGVWLKLFKKNSQVKGISYDQALDEALCFGWIDGLTRSFDENAFVQRFTPRRLKSIWSQRNREHIARLTKLGRMQLAGMAQVATAKADGRWAAAYASPANTKPPQDFLEALAKNKKAQTFFEKLNKTNSYAMIWQINTAKRLETRQRRIAKFVEMLEKGEKLY